MVVGREIVLDGKQRRRPSHQGAAVRIDEDPAAVGLHLDGFAGDPFISHHQDQRGAHCTLGEVSNSDHDLIVLGGLRNATELETEDRHIVPASIGPDPSQGRRTPGQITDPGEGAVAKDHDLTGTAADEKRMSK